MRQIYSVMTLFIMVGLVLVPFGHISNGAAQNLVFIGNPDVPMNSVSAKDIKEIFLGKKKDWGNGQRLTFVVLDKSDAHNVFLKKYIKKSPSQFIAYWRKQVFSGKGQFPKAYKSEQDVIQYVLSNSGAIGYISAESVSEEVKIVSVN